MNQIIVKSGKALLEDVPQPLALPGTVLVKVAYSCISQGTEISGVKNSGKSKLEKTVSILKEKPQAIQKAIDLYKEQGLASVYTKYKSATQPDSSPRPVDSSSKWVASVMLIISNSPKYPVD